jgi:hypothetical protein
MKMNLSSTLLGRRPERGVMQAVRVRKRWFCIGTLLLCPLVFALSASGAVYYINPVSGDDSADGGRRGPWRGFAPLNKITLEPGDRVEIVEAGELHDTLAPAGAGTAQDPVVIRFAPGRYDWFPKKLLTRKLAISNTNEDPDGDKAVAMELRQVAWFRIEGEGAIFYCRGKMMQIHIERSKDVLLTGFAFDYQRPTVSEYTVESLGSKDAVLAMHPDSTYTLKDGKVVWVGEGWRADSGGYGQIFDPRDNTVRRAGSPLGKIKRAEILSPGKVQVYFDKNPGFVQGLVYQHRVTRRDYAAVFCDRSERIHWDAVKFHFMHGMGVVSQFSRDLVFRDALFAPRPESKRTCAAWADMLHFSGCAGKITVENVRFFGANDDAINIHGTHLRIVRTSRPNHLWVRFMHRETFGFPAFFSGDEVDFISAKTLLPYATATVAKAELLDSRTMELTLSKPIPNNIKADDVLENATWTAAVEIKNCLIEAIPTRGFLLTTRQPILVADNVFRRTNMSAILVADDAKSWFESGMVRDLTIRGNTFDHCAEPVLNFHPENPVASETHPVHANIKILGNTFFLRGRGALALKSTGEVTLAENQFILGKNQMGITEEILIKRHASPPVKTSRNKID